MAIFKVPARVIKLIESKIGGLFDSVKGVFLGPKSYGKGLMIAFDKQLSLSGMYETASREEGGIPDIQTLSTLNTTAENYLDSLKSKAVNQVIKDIEKHLHENPKANSETIQQSIVETWASVSNNLKMIVESETQAAKNIALIDGILRVNASSGIDDPYVIFIPVKDNLVCNECVKIHLMPDGVTPKVFKLSEVSRSYHKRGENSPSIFNLHPNCRCVMSTILPGYGFNEKGRVKYISKDHDEYKNQRGI